MGLSDLSDPKAVELAISEWDEIGRDAFLKLYGFGAATGYQLKYNGRTYDPKAIAGRAHGYQFAALGALRSEDFTGGESGANKTLRGLGFNVTDLPERGTPGKKAKGARNPTWGRDELVLALDLYIQCRPKTPGKNSPEVAELSSLLNRIQAAVQKGDAKTYRNTNGVSMKVANFKRVDPDYTGTGRVGLQNGGKLEEEVWNTFATDRERLTATASAIRAAIAAGIVGQSDTADDDLDDMDEAPEGRILTSLHRRRERNRKLVKRRKAQALKDHGHLRCEACEFDFGSRYGERGLGFIECHHTKPLFTLKPDDRTHVDDLALLCANCHRMIHRRGIWLTIEELTALLANPLP